jgi:flagellar hook-length control protein FliK
MGDAARAAPAHPALQSAPAAALQVYTRFIERFDGRAQRFEVRLDPAELGRVDVRIEVGAGKKVHAILAAHDSAALTDLMRGQRALERALSDAGVDLSDGGIQFELAEDSGRGLAGHDQRNGAWSAEDEARVWRNFSTVDVGLEAGAADVSAATYSYGRRMARLDLVA